MGRTAGVWTNWADTASCLPRRRIRASSEDAIVAAVRAAADEGLRVKAVGAGHSFTDAACTDGMLLRVDGHDRVLEADSRTGVVTVEAGITLLELNARLGALGMALENLGDIAYQSVAGAIATGTHGTGARFGNLPSQVLGLSLVTAEGSVLRCSSDENADVFDAARVSVGALGVVSTVTLRAVPAFNLHAVERPAGLDETLESIDDLVASNEHFELYWFPHTDRVQTLRNNRTDEPPRPRGRVSGYVNDVLIENHGFHAVQLLGRLRPAWVPRLSRFTARGWSASERVDRSDRVFASPRLVRFAEMEYAIPRERVADAVRAVRSLIERRRYRISFPVEVRFSAGDDAWLSMAHGRDTAYVAVHVFRGTEHEPYFGDVEAVMRDLDGRPHWGKLHFRTAEDLAPAYPAWERFRAIRARLDPQGRFANAYTDRVLGPAA